MQAGLPSPHPFRGCSSDLFRAVRLPPKQVSYAIGVSHPLSISIFHYGTSQKSERELLEIVKKNFDLRPGVIVR